MSTDLLFPPIELHDTEKDIILGIFSNPSVKKYLRQLVAISTAEMIAYPVTTSPPIETAQALAKLQGRMEVYHTLLSINSPTIKE